MTDPLLTELGGSGAVQEAVRLLYVRVLADDELSPVFLGHDVEEIAEHMVHFLEAASGGADRSRGPDLTTAHRGLGVTDEMFDRLAGYLLEVLEEVGAPPGAVDEVATHLGPLRPLVVGAPGSDLA